MRSLLQILLAAATLIASGCRDADARAAQRERDVRLVVLDSLVEAHPGRTVHARLLYDTRFWSRPRACAVAAHAVAVLGRTPALEPYFAPTDTSLDIVLSIRHDRWCAMPSAEQADTLGRMSAAYYTIGFQIPGRRHFLWLMLDAKRLTGHIVPENHPRGLWVSSLVLTTPVETPDTLVAGVRCDVTARATAQIVDDRAARAIASR